MDDITADSKPDPQTGDTAVESDRLRPIVRLRLGLVHRASTRLPAGVVLGMIAVLAASGLAFGAQMLPILQSGNPAASQMEGQLTPATPVVVSDQEEPTALPTLAPEDSPASSQMSPELEPTLVPSDPPNGVTSPTSTPRPIIHATLPPSGYLSFAAKAEGGCARLYWAAFDDPSRAYYRVVRSTDAGVEWPLGAHDTLVASFRDAGQVSTLDCPAAGTYTYRVFVDEATSAGYVVLVSSNSMTIALIGST